MSAPDKTIRPFTVKQLKHPHDSFFKRIMSDVRMVREFLRCFLPKELAHAIDYSSLRIVDTEKTTRRYRKYYLDLAIECDMAHEDSQIYFVFEHKSYPDRLTYVQILNYCSAVWEQDIKRGERPRPIVPIVFYHGPRRFELPINFSDYFNLSESLKEYLLDLRIVLFDITQIKDEEIMKATKDLYLATALLTMKHVFDDLDAMKPVFQMGVKLDHDHFLIVLEYVTMAKDVDEKKLEETLKEAGVKTMPSLAQKWLEQGIQQGIQQGMEQGMEQGMLQDAQEMVMEVLEERFGVPSASLIARIKGITTRETLKALLKCAVRAKNLDDFRMDLEKALE